MLEEERLDRLINRYLSQQLDPQLGRAAANFETDLRKRPARRNPWPRRLIWMTTAAAACLALAWGWRFQNHLAQKPGSNGPTQIVEAEPSPDLVPVTESISWRTIDDGVIGVEDDVPIRQLRNQVLQYVQWYDPQRKATVEMTVPREEIVLVGLQSH